MITYKKAIELIDNGYPAKGIWFGKDDNGNKFMFGGPSLNNLLDECKILFDGNITLGGKINWWAVMRDENQKAVASVLRGKYPGMVLADLWLELKKYNETLRSPRKNNKRKSN